MEKHGNWQVYDFGKMNVFRLHLNESRVSVGEEGGGHCMLMDPKQKRCGNQQWRLWCKESGG